MRKFKAFVLSFLILFGLWMIVGGTTRDELITGGITAVILSLAFSRRLEVLADLNISFRSLYSLVKFILVFMRELFRSAIDVAKRVLSPRLPINPGIVKVRCTLKSPIGRLALANAITLTPGTMTVETIGEYYYIHWIDIQTPDIDGATQAIVCTFQNHLEVIFG